MSDDNESTSEVDEFTGVQTTGHEWDGIKELDNPMPRWWLWTFYASIIFAVGYMFYYPAIPLLETSTMGFSGLTTRLELRQEMEQLDLLRRDKLALLEKKTLVEIQNDEELSRFAIAGGASIFKVYCTQCHGSGAAGGPGYPNLNDDDWIWGGDVDSIYETIAHGARSSDDDDTRESQMPGFGADGILEKEQIQAVAEYVLKLSKQEHNSDLASVGQIVFAEQCSACHGETGLGVRDVGGPNLADAIWLYGGTRAEIRSQINKSKHGIMPPWLDRLKEANVKQLTIYVHSLGGGEKAKAE